MCTLQRKIKTALLTGALSGGILGAYAFFVEPRWLEVTHTRVHIEGLPSGMEGFRIALLTDLHTYNETPFSIVRRACHLAMTEEPDLIALTGDFGGINSRGLRRVIDILSVLEAPLGVYGVPGNHDYHTGIDDWHRFVKAYPTLVDLTNRRAARQVDGARLCIVGVDAFNKGEPHLEEALPPRGTDCITILLAHNPEQAEQVRSERKHVDLVLSGHTHGGQVRLPFVGALRNPVQHENIYEEGLVRRPWTQVYISRGVGMARLPVRFLCRPEVAILILH